METGNLSTRAVNSGSVNRALVAPNYEGLDSRHALVSNHLRSLFAAQECSIAFEIDA